MVGSPSFWSLFVGSHLLRYLWEDSSATHLRSEISVLRVEVHRAKMLVSDNNHVLEACERESHYLKTSSHLGALINIGLGIVCTVVWFVNYCRARERRVTHPLEPLASRLSQRHIQETSVLLHKIGGGRWVLLTPDLDLHVEDLSTHRRTVLGRHAPFPAAIVNQCYIFDEIAKAELERQRRLAKTMGSILDDAAQVTVDMLQWVVADVSSSKLPVPPEILDDIIALGQHGLVNWDGETLYIRELEQSEISGFVEQNKESVGDLRTLGDHRDAQGHRHLGFQEETKFDDWSFKGPRSVLEYLRAALQGPGNLISYHNMWVRSSGIAVSQEHHHLCETLRLAISKDQLDVSNLASLEAIPRGSCRI